MPRITPRQTRPYGHGFVKVTMRMDGPEWAVFCAIMSGRYNTSGSDGVRQLVSQVVKEHEYAKRARQLDEVTP